MQPEQTKKNILWNISLWILFAVKLVLKVSLEMSK